MELIENLQVTQSNETQLIRVKSAQSFRGAFRTQLKKSSKVDACLGPQYLYLWSWQ